MAGFKTGVPGFKTSMVGFKTGMLGRDLVIEPVLYFVCRAGFQIKQPYIGDLAFATVSEGVGSTRLKERDTILSALAGVDCAFTPAIKKVIEQTPSGVDPLTPGEALVRELGLSDEWQALVAAETAMRE